MTAIAVHRAENPLPFRSRRSISLEGIGEAACRRGDASGKNVLVVADRWRRPRRPPAPPRVARSAARRDRDQREPRYRAKTQTMPPWLVCRARSGAKSAGGRTSAGSSERTSPDSRNQSPPMPAYIAMYCFPSGPRNEIGAPTTPEPTLNFHNCRPVLASAALNQPSSVPKKTTSPAVTTLPLHTGNFSSIFQTLRPRAASQAMNAPMYPPGPAKYGVVAPMYGVPGMRVTGAASKFIQRLFVAV